MLPASPIAVLDGPQGAVVTAIFALCVVRPDLVHGGLVPTASAGVATRIPQATGDGLQGHVAGLQKLSRAARAGLQLRPAAGAGVVPRVAKRDGWRQVLATHRTREELEHVVSHLPFQHHAAATKDRLVGGGRVVVRRACSPIWRSLGRISARRPSVVTEVLRGFIPGKSWHSTCAKLALDRLLSILLFINRPLSTLPQINGE